MSDSLCFVQFPHPGREHSPDRDGWKDWNADTHARKFMKCPGRWRTAVEGAGVEHDGDLVLWGEWEPPSKVIGEYDPPDIRWPRYLHLPFWQRSPDGSLVSNTDPFVFGDRFLYSNCRQNSKNGPLRTQRLAVGSLILFGSRFAGEFVIDTVFVVGSGQPLTATTVNRLVGIDDVFEAVVCDMLFRDAGATPVEPVGRMFSFFPCLPVTDAPNGFPRPSIRLEDRINPNNWRSVKITEALSHDEIETLWLRIVHQVLGQGSTLGAHAATPPKIPSDYTSTDNNHLAGGCVVYGPDRHRRKKG